MKQLFGPPSTRFPDLEALCEKGDEAFAKRKEEYGVDGTDDRWRNVRKGGGNMGKLLENMGFDFTKVLEAKKRAMDQGGTNADDPVPLKIEFEGITKTFDCDIDKVLLRKRRLRDNSREGEREVGAPWLHFVFHERRR